MLSTLLDIELCSTIINETSGISFAGKAFLGVERDSCFTFDREINPTLEGRVMSFVKL